MSRTFLGLGLCLEGGCGRRVDVARLTVHHARRNILARVHLATVKLEVVKGLLHLIGGSNLNQYVYLLDRTDNLVTQAEDLSLL